MNKGLTVAVLAGIAWVISKQKAEAAPGEPEPEPQPEPEPEPQPGRARFYMPAVMESITKAITILRIPYNRTTYRCLITNKGSAAGTRKVVGEAFYNGTRFSDRTEDITLAAGESYTWTKRVDVQTIKRGSYKLTGDWAEDNCSEGWA